MRYKEVFIGADFRNTIYGSNLLKSVLSDRLIEHFGNCLDHMKMYPLYEAMGFAPEKFLYDFEKHKCSSAELRDLKRFYKERGFYNKKAVDLYFGKFIAIMTDFNQALDYEMALDTLYQIDPLLYNTLDRFILKWEELISTTGW